MAANNDYEINLTVPTLTQNVFDKGAVDVYFQATTNTTGWATLPATIGGISINVAHYLNQVQLVSSTASSGLFNIKVVVIPPAMRKPGVNHANYEEVKAAYNL